MNIEKLIEMSFQKREVSIDGATVFELTAPVGDRFLLTGPVVHGFYNGAYSPDVAETLVLVLVEIEKMQRSLFPDEDAVREIVSDKSVLEAVISLLEDVDFWSRLV